MHPLRTREHLLKAPLAFLLHHKPSWVRTWTHLLCTRSTSFACFQHIPLPSAPIHAPAASQQMTIFMRVAKGKSPYLDYAEAASPCAFLPYQITHWNTTSNPQTPLVKLDKRNQCASPWVPHSAVKYSTRDSPTKGAAHRHPFCMPLANKT
jgi:hypothetical protein